MSSIAQSSNNDSNISNPFDNLMAYLEGKENGIENGSIVIPEKKVKISDKRIEKDYLKFNYLSFCPVGIVIIILAL